MAWKEKHGSDTIQVIEALLVHFPPEEIAQELFNLYFEHSNPYLPLLHRPTFDRQWKSQLHRENVWFAMNCMLIFGLASRWIKGTEEGASDRSDSGVDWAAMRWKWFSLSLDAMLVQRSLFGAATLLEIQSLAVCTQIFVLINRNFYKTLAYVSLLAWIIMWTYRLAPDCSRD
jgi:hypothetical protein